MRILLIILTVTGILLLVLLVLAAVCLFYPVSYRIKGEAGEELSLYGRFRWLSGLFRFEFEVRDFKPRMQFGILWLKWSFGGEETEEEELRKEEARKEPGADAPVQKKRAALPEKKNGRSAETAAPEKKAGGSAETAVSEETARTEQHSAKRKKEDRENRKRNRPGRKRFPKKRGKAASSHRSRRKGTFKETCSGFRTELSDEKNHLAVRHLWQEATYIFTHLKPKYAEGAVYFAAGDPALTGLITGMLSLLPVMYQYDACVCPDFVSDDPYLRGTIVFGGRMSLYCAVLCLIRIIRDENAMRLIQKFR